jgi:hypothetical protein
MLWVRKDVALSCNRQILLQPPGLRARSAPGLRGAGPRSPPVPLPLWQCTVALPLRRLRPQLAQKTLDHIYGQRNYFRFRQVQQDSFIDRRPSMVDASSNTSPSPPPSRITSETNWDWDKARIAWMLVCMRCHDVRHLLVHWCRAPLLVPAYHLLSWGTRWHWGNGNDSELARCTYSG